MRTQLALDDLVAAAIRFPRDAAGCAPGTLRHHDRRWRGPWPRPCGPLSTVSNGQQPRLDALHQFDTLALQRGQRGRQRGARLQSRSSARPRSCPRPASPSAVLTTVSSSPSSIRTSFELFDPLALGREGGDLVPVRANTWLVPPASAAPGTWRPSAERPRLPFRVRAWRYGWRRAWPWRVRGRWWPRPAAHPGRRSAPASATRRRASSARVSRSCRATSEVSAGSM